MANGAERPPPHAALGERGCGPAVGRRIVDVHYGGVDTPIVAPAQRTRLPTEVAAKYRRPWESEAVVQMLADALSMFTTERTARSLSP